MKKVAGGVVAHVVVGVVSDHVALPHHPHHRPPVGIVSVLHLVGVDEESCLHSDLLQGIQNRGGSNVWSVVKCKVEIFILRIFFNRIRSGGDGGGSEAGGGRSGGGGSP